VAVYPTSWAIEMGLGGSFRSTLVDDEFVTMILPLSDLAGDRAKDICGRGNHGTFNGTGWTFGVPMSVPEGVMGTSSDGNGYIEVPDDGGPEVTGVYNLSLSGNRIGIVVLLKTTHNSATARCLVCKQDTNSTGNGWHVALVSAGIRFYLEVGGSVIFDFTRGSVADGNLHVIYCLYRPDANEAKIFIDGVQSGLAATGTTEPAATTAPLRCFMFTDGVAGDGSGFIGTLAMVMTSREGNPDLATLLQPTIAWTNASTDVRAMLPIEARQGIPGNGPLDNMARPGTLTFAMNNAVTNTGGVIGYYSPGHASCRSGFQIGTPVRWSVTYGGTTYRLFYGFIQGVAPAPGAYGSRVSVVTCSDWIGVASRVPMSAVAAQTNVTSDDVIKLVMDQIEGRVPPAVAISQGASEFSFALDVSAGATESVLTELARIVGSERGFFYQRGDTTNDAVVVFESRADRQLLTALDATFSNTMHGLDVRYGLEQIVNIVRVIVTPRRVDTVATTVLYTLDISEQDITIAAGETLVIESGYRDPTESSKSVGGVEMVEPVANTDYGFNASQNGTGADLSGSLRVFTDGGRMLGGSSFRIELRNEGDVSGYLRLNSTTALQLRGKGVYFDQDPLIVERRNGDSVRKHGPRTVQIDLMYESDISVATAVADFLLGILSDQRPVPESLSILGNANATLMGNALALKIGDKVGVIESVTGIKVDAPDSDAEIGFYINEKMIRQAPGGIITATFGLAASGPEGTIWILDEVGASELDETTVMGY
jgi:hypothetical protein